MVWTTPRLTHFGAPTVAKFPLACRCLSVPRHEKITSEVQRYLEDTERNILELNKSRLKALEQVQHEKLLRYKAEQALSAMQEENVKLRKEIATLREKSSVLDDAPERMQQPQSVEKERDATGEEASALKRSPVMTLHYSTGWNRAYIHYNADGRGWTKNPGVKMERRGKEHVIAIEGESMEFVLNNGRDEWDHPLPLDEKRQNYTINESGEFLLKHGSIQKM